MAIQQYPSSLSAADIREHFVDGVNVFVSGGAGQPDAAIRAIRQAELTSQFRIIDNSLPGMTALNPNHFSSAAIMNTGFFLGAYREYYEQGKLEFVPAFHSARFRAIEEEYDINIAVLKLSEPNGEGYCSAGLHADYSTTMVNKADLIIAEINSAMPFIDDALKISVNDINYCVTSGDPLIEYSVAPASDTDKQIASHISDLVEDGDCIQLGIGTLPVSILESLGNKKDLGIHTGLLTEAVMPLVEAGVVNGSKKNIDAGKIITGIVAGSTAFYEWSAKCPDLCMKPVTYTHDGGVLASIDRLVGINTTLEIDLFGQINSETIRGKQIGGVGGLVDFLRGARTSKGGRSIIALHSTARKGSISKIVPLINVAPVTVMRDDTDYVVTEFGVARVSNLSVEKRAEALINIAHPDFRASLASEWHDLLVKY
jgi:4-hydroxybutyrate CoA-transferase